MDCGRSFRVLNIIDDCDKVAVAQEVSMSMPAERVIKSYKDFRESNMDKW